MDSINGDDGGDIMFKMSDADSALRERLERTRREAEFSRKKLQHQHEEEIEEHETAKKVLDRKVCVVCHSVVVLLNQTSFTMLENYHKLDISLVKLKLEVKRCSS